ncbi:hypothetical protein GE21DRAFT_811 [Neurospora crassa]|uniref:Uncharacterized protein n=1 Tax=Neurospora crassa (strain ATCC 24698 / 74-OR23-1A / CBS 708.71 / DSM 1257 / FGSC 987) TaxID=367110 RepID=Q7SFZ8_NEUCR|nr:hypothetical protein NCU02622 [Neurospora crassa OR74A]EAA35789.1 hypothetical protein NCU02622 [Neurospora crassa OR74A]KHE90062.1 hypothetical protein GE21DRAFT_811 [Neurospora crassa]|eukprot:XP_965025.1 hypothetical protein NCU02622 [Neurospora crassa OR74A]
MAPKRTIQSLSRHLLSQSGRKAFVGEAGSSRSTKVFGRTNPLKIVNTSRFHPSEIQIGRWRCVPRWVFTPLVNSLASVWNKPTRQAPETRPRPLRRISPAVSNVTIFFCGSIGYGSRSLMVSSHTSDAPNSEQPKTGTTQACLRNPSQAPCPLAMSQQLPQYKRLFTERATAATM